MIEIDDLHKFYGDRKAVGPLSCSIADGEIVGLLGLNGAGKTTTLRILACDLLPSSGKVTVDGLDVVEHPHEVRSRIGYLPDTPPLYPEMTVSSYLRFAAQIRGLSRAEADRRVPEVEEQTELRDVSREPIASLSHGFKQRVGIAQAIVHRPRLLVLDEPITGLDPVQIVEMRELLRGLKGEHTILLSSHILSEISETCDRILVIKAGEIAAAGTEAELARQMLKGARAEITVRGSESRAKEAAAAVAGVSSVDVVAAAEPGDKVVSLRVVADRDVREDLCAALVSAGLGILQVGPGERELESVFLRLAGSTGQARNQAAATKAAQALAAAPAKTEAKDEAEDEEEGEA